MSSVAPGVMGIADLLRCPKCGGQFNLSPGSEWALGSVTELQTAQLDCMGCGRLFSLSDGIVDLAPEPSESAAREIEGNRKMVSVDRSTCDDEWLLRLPWSHASLRPECADHDEMSDWEAIRAQAQLHDNGALLDVGAGTCWTTERWASQGVRAIASDISLEKFIGLRSAEVLIRARGHRFDRVRFDMNQRWPFASSSLDFIVAMSSIHHGDSLDHCFGEASRIMKPTGTLLLVEATRSILVSAKAAGFGRREIEEFNLNEHIYSQLEFRRSARRAGLMLRFRAAGSFVKKIDMVATGSGFCGRSALKHRIAYRTRRLLATTFVKSLVTGRMFPLLNLIAGTQFVGVANRSRRLSELFGHQAQVAVGARKG